MSRRVVVTGLGIVVSSGHTTEEAWDSIKSGVCKIDKITRYDAAQHNVQIAAEIRDWDATKYLPRREVRRLDRYQQYGFAAAVQAIQQAGLEVQPENSHRVGVFVGSSVGGVESFNEQAILVHETDVRRVTPFGITRLMANGGSTRISMHIGAHGPSYTMTSACATGADCIGHAFNMVRSGTLDVAVAGCSDAPIIPIGIGAFDRIGATSRCNENPSASVRPFAKDREGLVFAEGAGVLILEDYERAKARDAEILAELVGYGVTSDAFHMTAPEPEGLGAGNAILAAMKDAKINAEDIHYINAHGTATELNDLMETKAVKRALGEHAYNIPMSSTKSMTGHGMGMTAAIESVFCVLALRDNVAPPTINLHEADPECDLDYVPNEARDVPINCTMSNSFGFGGHNSSLIYKSV